MTGTSSWGLLEPANGPISASDDHILRHSFLDFLEPAPNLPLAILLGRSSNLPKAIVFLFSWLERPAPALRLNFLVRPRQAQRSRLGRSAAPATSLLPTTPPALGTRCLPTRDADRTVGNLPCDFPTNDAGTPSFDIGKGATFAAAPSRHKTKALSFVTRLRHTVP